MSAITSPQAGERTQEDKNLLIDFFYLPVARKITVRARSGRADTFSHLEGLAWGRGVVCERYSARRIELTTPDGGTSAVCESVAEALDIMRNDSAFCKLPLKIGRAVI